MLCIRNIWIERVVVKFLVQLGPMHRAKFLFPIVAGHTEIKFEMSIDVTSQYQNEC